MRPFNTPPELSSSPSKTWMSTHFLFLALGLFSTLYFAFYMPMEKAYNTADQDSFTVNFELSENIEVFFDENASHSSETIHNASFKTLQPLHQLNWLRLPLTDNPVWLRFHLEDMNVKNPMKDWVYLEFGLPVINEIDVLVFDHNGIMTEQQRVGDEVPRSEWNLNLILPTIKFRPSSSGRNTVYVRLSSDSFLATPMFILTTDQLVHVTNWQRSFITPYYGMILVMLFYNFFTYTFMRDKSYLYYFGHIFFLLMYQAVLDGFLPETLIKVGDWLYLRSPVVYAGLANLCAMGFSRHMLQINNKIFWENLTLKICTSFVIISLVLELFLHNQISSLAMMITFSVNCAVVLCVIFSTLLKGNKLAGYFLLAWATYPILVSNYGITMAGLIAPNSFGIQAPRLGGIVETILLSVALGYRVELMRREKLQFQRSVNDELQSEIANISKGIQSLAAGKLNHTLAKDSGPYLASLSQDFEKLGEALQTNEQDRNRWLTDISHELKTPISVFKATIESLQDGVFDVNDSALERLHKESTRLERLVLDLHDLNVCESGSFNFSFKPTNILEVLAHEIEFFKPLLDEYGLTIRLHLQTGDSLVNIDEKRIAQLFTNLLSNSARYTDAPGTIKVTVESSKSYLSIHWDDSAPGAGSLEDISLLFDRLYKVDQSRVRDDTGTGLGLSICKAIVIAHKGNIAVNNSYLGGLRITITLPLIQT